MSHENVELMAQLKAKEQGTHALEAHIKLLEREHRRLHNGHTHLASELERERLSHRKVNEGLVQENEELQHVAKELALLRHLVEEDLHALPIPDEQGASRDGGARTVHTANGNGLLPSLQERLGGRPGGEMDKEEAAQIGQPGASLTVFEIGARLKRRREQIDLQRRGEATGLAMGEEDSKRVTVAIEEAIEEAARTMGSLQTPRGHGGAQVAEHVDGEEGGENVWDSFRGGRGRQGGGGGEFDDDVEEIGTHGGSPAGGDGICSTSSPLSAQSVGSAGRRRKRKAGPADGVLQASRSAAREAASAGASSSEALSRSQRAASDAELAFGSTGEYPTHASSIPHADPAPTSDAIAEAVKAARAVAELRGDVEADIAHEMVEAAIANGMSAMEAAAAAIGMASVEQAAAASEAAWRAEAAHPNGPPLSAAVSAHVAALVVAAGGLPGVAASAGAHAANAFLRGESLTSVHAQAVETAKASRPFDETRAAAMGCVPLPGWSLEQWVRSLSLDEYITRALVRRLTEMAAPNPTAPLELPFLMRLADVAGGVETILALLKEQPVLTQIAERVHQEAKKMLDRRRQPTASADAGKQTRRLRGVGRAALILGQSSTSSKLNAEFISAGARTLFFSKDASLYWEGISRLVGKARPDPAESLAEAMEREHCRMADADVPFDARNYQTRTTSRLEWMFVAKPEALPQLTPHLEKLGQPAGHWPMIGSMSESTDDDQLRHPKTFAQFEKKRREIDARLAAHGEQPISFVEFAALRCYSGPVRRKGRPRNFFLPPSRRCLLAPTFLLPVHAFPYPFSSLHQLFVKYNNILRAGVCDDFLDFLDHVCRGNRYPTTIHVLAAAIMKLGKFSGAPRLVYRAPGGALPANFWQRAQNGTIGILEAGCLSTSTEKEEAIHYAMRSDAKLIFEVQQSYVGRGASISWLSQYPTEAEILFPPGKFSLYKPPCGTA